MWLNKLGGGVCIAFWILYALLSCYFLISFLNFNKLWYDYLRYYGQWMEGLMPCRDLFDQKGPLIWSMEWPFYCSNDFGWSFCWSWWPYLFPWHSVIRLMFYLFPPKRRFLFFCCLFCFFCFSVLFFLLFCCTVCLCLLCVLFLYLCILCRKFKLCSIIICINIIIGKEA